MTPIAPMERDVGEAEHTPGPWRAEFQPFGSAIYVENGKTIATAHGYAAITGEGFPHEANARLIAAAPKLKDALAAMLDFWGGYECPEVDAAIAVMQEIGEDRWSMQAQIDAAAKQTAPALKDQSK